MEQLQDKLSKTNGKIEELERRLEKERSQKKKIEGQIRDIEKRQEADRIQSVCRIVDTILGKVAPEDFSMLEVFLIAHQEEFEHQRLEDEETASAITEDTLELGEGNGYEPD